MRYSVGILYSASMFLQKIEEKKVLASEFKDALRKFGLIDSATILEICQTCNWIKISEDGYCGLTDRGRVIIESDEPELVLRKQLKDIIEILQPSWVYKMKSGRTEVKNFLKDEVNQIFKEAGLYKPWNDELIEWWDQLSLSSFSAKSYERLKIGRDAESKTVAYEQIRTKIEPEWISLESNNAGYDIVSRISDTNDDQLLIEVKGTKQLLKEAYFYLTRYEWDTGKSKKNYMFYLWVLREPLLLLPVQYSDVSMHVPLDQEKGRWQNVMIPYRFFQSCKQYIKNVI